MKKVLNFLCLETVNLDKKERNFISHKVYDKLFSLRRDLRSVPNQIGYMTDKILH